MRLEIHPTPVHGSWLNMAETELSILDRPCLDRPPGCDEGGPKGGRCVCETQRNKAKITINWRFTIADARVSEESLPVNQKLTDH